MSNLTFDESENHYKYSLPNPSMRISTIPNLTQSQSYNMFTFSWRTVCELPPRSSHRPSSSRLSRQRRVRQRPHRKAIAPFPPESPARRIAGRIPCPFRRGHFWRLRGHLCGLRSSLRFRSFERPLELSALVMEWGWIWPGAVRFGRGGRGKKR